MSEPLLVTVAEARPVLHIGRDGIYDLIRTGRLRVVRVGRKVLIPVAELAAFVEREAGEQA